MQYYLPHKSARYSFWGLGHPSPSASTCVIVWALAYSILQIKALWSLSVDPSLSQVLGTASGAWEHPSPPAPTCVIVWTLAYSILQIKALIFLRRSLLSLKFKICTVVIRVIIQRLLLQYTTLIVSPSEEVGGRVNSSYLLPICPGFACFSHVEE